MGLWSEWVGGYSQYVYYSQVFSFLKTEFFYIVLMKYFCKLENTITTLPVGSLRSKEIHRTSISKITCSFWLINNIQSRNWKAQKEVFASGVDRHVCLLQIPNIPSCFSRYHHHLRLKNITVVVSKCCFLFFFFFFFQNPFCTIWNLLRFYVQIFILQAAQRST